MQHRLSLTLAAPFAQNSVLETHLPLQKSLGAPPISLSKLLHRNQDFPGCLLAMRVDGVEIGLDLLEHIGLEVLLAAVFALLAGNIFDDHEPTVVPIDVLHDRILEVLIAAEIAYLLHR
jgi:hypothetical protein